jgi:hypothetical protein
MKERILMIRMEYSVLKEKMKENECGWSECCSFAVARKRYIIYTWDG